MLSLLKDNSRIDKSLHTDNPIGKPILKIQTSDESTQAQFVAKEIRNIIDGSKGMISYKDFAVLMRMNATSQQFEHCFRANKIPFTIVSFTESLYNLQASSNELRRYF